MSLSDVSFRKQQLREQIWLKMEKSGVATFPLPCRGRIPNFDGADVAAYRLSRLEEWEKAEIIFVSPDSPQRMVREKALKDGKIVVMASPNLRKGFIMIRPESVVGRERFASTIKGALTLGKEAYEFPKPDLVVEGSVAVDQKGFRLGKGRGYGDLEIKILKNRFGEILVATTVHDLQVVESVPFEEKDEKVSIIVTPTRVIRVKPI